MAGDRIDRTVSIGFEDSGFTDGMQKARQGGEEMYDAFIKKAESYTNKLNAQAVKVQNLIDKEQEAKRYAIEERRVNAEAMRDEKIASLDPKSESYGQDKQKAVKSYAAEIKNLNKEQRDFNVTVNEAHRKSKEHFAETQPSEGRVGKFMKGAAVGGALGAAGGLLSGGNLGGLASTIMGGVGGGISNAFGGLGAAVGVPMVASAPVVGAMINQGSNLAESRAKLNAQLGGTSRPGFVPDLTAQGVDTAATLARERELARLGGHEMAKEVANFTKLEKGMSLESGELNKFAGMAHMGFGHDIPNLLGKFLNTAVDSGLWDIDKGDLSQIPEKLTDLHNMLSTEAMTTTHASGMSVGLQTALGGAGELFSSGRFGTLFNSLQQGMSNPTNEFQRARMFEEQMALDPSLSGDSHGLTKIRSRISKGMFQEGAFAQTLKDIKQRTGGDKMDMREQFVQKFPQFLSFFEDEDAIDPLFESSFLKKITNLGGEEAIKGEMKKAVGKDLFQGGTSTNQQMQTKIASLLQKNGEFMSDTLSGYIISLIEGTDATIVALSTANTYLSKIAGGVLDDLDDIVFNDTNNSKYTMTQKYVKSLPPAAQKAIQRQVKAGNIVIAP